MYLVLRGLSLNDSALSQPLVGRFDERGGTIGRSDTATMTLPDPERLISRVQANIAYVDGAYWLEDVGSANPVVCNGQPLGPGVRAQLKPNDDLRIGGYRLTVEYEETDSGATILRGRATAPPPISAPAAAANPFADLLTPAPRAAHPFADVLPPGPFASPPAQPKLPEDFDPFADFAPKPSPAPPPAQDPLALVAAAPGSGQTIDDLFGLKPGAERDPLADFLAPPAAKSADSPLPLDPLALFEPRPAAPPPPATPAAANHVPELAGAYQPPKVVAPPRPQPEPRPAAPVPQPAAASSTHSAEDIWRGFLEGAGVDIQLPRGVTPEMMRTVGVMLRLAIEGLLQLIAVRAAAKNELRAPMTVIQVRDNNPLKFSPDVTAALLQLLQPPGRGFLSGPAAIRDAMIDLQSHQIGTMAGMRAALAGVLKRFEPELLERRLTTHSVLDALLPMNRKAKLWELFLEHYRSIRDDAEDDFHELFGKAFVQAYQAQVERLQAAQEKSSAARR